MILSLRASEYKDQKEISWGRMGQKTQMLWIKSCVLIGNFGFLLAQRGSDVYLVICLSRDALHLVGLWFAPVEKLLLSGNSYL